MPTYSERSMMNETEFHQIRTKNEYIISDRSRKHLRIGPETDFCACDLRTQSICYKTHTFCNFNIYIYMSFLLIQRNILQTQHHIHNAG